MYKGDMIAVDMSVGQDGKHFVIKAGTPYPTVIRYTLVGPKQQPREEEGEKKNTPRQNLFQPKY